MEGLLLEARNCLQRSLQSWMQPPTHAHSHEDAGLRCDREVVCLAYQLIRKVILCFQYETFHSVKSNPKTSWIQSSHTFKCDYLVLTIVQSV